MWKAKKEKEQVLYFSFQKCESMDVLYFFIVSFPCYLQYQMVELEIFKVNQSVIWNGKQTDTTKEKRNNHARIHFTFICCPDVSKDTKRTGIFKDKTR